MMFNVRTPETQQIIARIVMSEGTLPVARVSESLTG
eukprot:CAMPEP_0174376018 /NCGR_PEP_ID=MMETSP0811_2-20130205/116683_1 /TAXON_ID=73025 ORGANISM="Eutreptiella gymnastica-like, Strain CCMP1594" /NCGR_SAMPLE_ID=MMETSP0811_2 /ASSEMBLY_ACC=CAM_ASM_000667 /LENGTH=35 /DNA_ID= /DNA_START= /DNA_END= /DNA_ORIENTATION=